jgi:hypothetical protein
VVLAIEHLRSDDSRIPNMKYVLEGTGFHSRGPSSLASEVDNRGHTSLNSETDSMVPYSTIASLYYTLPISASIQYQCRVDFTTHPQVEMSALRFAV